MFPYILITALNKFNSTHVNLPEGQSFHEVKPEQTRVEFKSG